MRLPDNLLATLEIALNRYLAEDPEALGRLQAFGDQVMALHLREFDARVYLRPHGGGFQVLGDCPDTPAATVSASLPVLARMLLSDDKGRSLVLGGEISIEGDTDFAQALLAVLREADFDPEEWLSRYIGDVAAYRAGQFFRSIFQQGRRSLDSLTRDSVGLFKEEGGNWAARQEIAGWLDGVDGLRSDVERLEARVRRLIPDPENET